MCSDRVCRTPCGGGCWWFTLKLERIARSSCVLYVVLLIDNQGCGLGERRQPQVLAPGRRPLPPQELHLHFARPQPRVSVCAHLDSLRLATAAVRKSGILLAQALDAVFVLHFGAFRYVSSTPYASLAPTTLGPPVMFFWFSGPPSSLAVMLSWKLQHGSVIVSGSCFWGRLPVSGADAMRRTGAVTRVVCFVAFFEDFFYYCT